MQLVSGLATYITGNSNDWTDLNYAGSPENLQVGEAIDARVWDGIGGDSSGSTSDSSANNNTNTTPTPTYSYSPSPTITKSSNNIGSNSQGTGKAKIQSYTPNETAFDSYVNALNRETAKLFGQYDECGNPYVTEQRADWNRTGAFIVFGEAVGGAVSYVAKGAVSVVKGIGNYVGEGIGSLWGKLWGAGKGGTLGNFEARQYSGMGNCIIIILQQPVQLFKQTVAAKWSSRKSAGPFCSEQWMRVLSEKKCSGRKRPPKFVFGGRLFLPSGTATSRNLSNPLVLKSSHRSQPIV